jgi:multisubunit Na+/H+ antiporter MnhB subunit
VASRRPENPVGWLMLAGGAVNAVTQFAGAYAAWGLVRHPGSLPGASAAAWLSSFLWEPAIAILVGVAAYFPTGRLPSRRWRWLPITAALASVVIVAASAVGLWSLRGRALIAENADVALHTYVKAVIGAVYPVVLACAVAALLSVVIRYRRARGIERQQMKWLMWAAVVTVPGVVAGQVLNGNGGDSGLVQLLGSPAWFTIAAALAILRYRLYDIDRIVSRTVSYLAVTALVIGVYVGLVALIETGLGFSGGVAVAASTLAAAAAFQPLRSRVQRAVDRRFDRAAYDARRTAEAFAQRLRDEVDVATISSDLVTTVDEAVAPTFLSVWLAHA